MLLTIITRVCCCSCDNNSQWTMLLIAGNGMILAKSRVLDKQCAQTKSYNLFYLLSMAGVLCDRPGDLANGDTTMTSVAVGGQVSWSCNPGYELTGSCSATCESSGVWSSPPPVCEREYDGQRRQCDVTVVTSIMLSSMTLSLCAIAELSIGLSHHV